SGPSLHAVVNGPLSRSLRSWWMQEPHLTLDGVMALVEADLPALEALCVLGVAYPGDPVSVAAPLGSLPAPSWLANLHYLEVPAGWFPAAEAGRLRRLECLKLRGRVLPEAVVRAVCEEPALGGLTALALPGRPEEVVVLLNRLPDCLPKLRALEFHGGLRSQ